MPLRKCHERYRMMSFAKHEAESKQNTQKLKWLCGCGRLLLAFVFFYAGIVKLFDQHAFAVVIAGYGLLPESLIFPAAIVLPVVEVVTAVGLIVRLSGFLTLAVVQLFIFIGVLSYGILLGLDVDCGCFGPDDPEQAYHGLKGALLRDFGLLAVAFIVIWQENKRRQMNRKVGYLTTETKEKKCGW